MFVLPSGNLTESFRGSRNVIINTYPLFDEVVLTSKKPNSYGVPGGPTTSAFILRISESSYVTAKARDQVRRVISFWYSRAYTNRSPFEDLKVPTPPQSIQ